MSRSLKALLCALSALCGMAAQANHQDPCAAVRAAVSAAAASGVAVDVQCTAAQTDQAPAGSAGWVLAEPLPAIEAGPTRFVLATRLPDGSVRRMGLAVRLGLRSEAWVLQRQVRAGEEVSVRDVVRLPVEWMPGERRGGASAVPPMGRARQALREGQVIESSHVADAAGLLPGDAVTALIQQDGLVVRIPAVLVRSARVGERVLVQLKDRRATLEGRLVDRNLVDVGL
jgi:flagella basal body P-ring formation protein FlgA